MKIASILFLLISCSELYSQLISVEYEDAGRIFRLSKSDKVYAQSDSIDLTLQIINSSKEDFFIFDTTRLHSKPLVKPDNTVEFNYSPDIKFGYAMKILKRVRAGDSITLHIKPSSRLISDHEVLKAYVTVGYINFSEDFIPFTKSSYPNLEQYRETVVEDMNVFRKLLGAYRIAKLEYLALRVKN